MAQEKLNFADKIYYYIKQLVMKVTYSQNLFDEDVWQLRFSKQQEKRKYTIEKSLFSLSLKSADDIFKYLLWISLVVMLVFMILMSRHVGISEREIVQNDYSELVLGYFHHDVDAATLHAHPYASSQAQHIDLLLCTLGKILHVNNIFILKHLVSSIFGWLLIVYLSVLILRAFNWRAAFLTAFFLFISPRFLGYSVCNVVDVTFAFGFIFTITQIYYFCRELPVIRIYRVVKIVLGTLLALSTFNAGFILVHFFIIFVILNFLLYNPLKKLFKWEYLKPLCILVAMLAGFTILVYSVHAVCTLFLESSVVRPNQAFALLTANYPLACNQLFEGHIIGPDNYPQYYLSKYLYITIPTVILIGFVLFFVFFKTAVKSLKPYSIFIFLYTFFYCVFKVRTHYLNPDTAWAIYYCIYPLFMLIAVSGYECTLQKIDDKYTNFVVMGLMALMSFMPIRHILFTQPLTSLYFNEITGGIHNAYSKYELDAVEDANKQAFQWMGEYIHSHEIGHHIDETAYVVGTNGNSACPLFLSKDTNIVIVRMPFVGTDTVWDYYIDFCHGIPATQLRNGTWPSDTTIHRINFETKPVVAFYCNHYRARQRLMRDSIANEELLRLDSIANYAE
ncbi:MAG: hypothetical protein J6S48_02455 [Bacteroidales bacterium]|nr:hypothetical protein [Bacteroidales bacterium]